MIHDVHVHTLDHITTIFLKLPSRHVMDDRRQNGSIKYAYGCAMVKESINKLHIPLLLSCGH